VLEARDVERRNLGQRCAPVNGAGGLGKDGTCISTICGPGCGSSRTNRRENSSAVARPTNDFKTVQIDLGGGIAEFEEFTKAMRIGDRVRAYCDDGVIEAEKVSQTRFKLIYNLRNNRTNPLIV
jgi:hypothetical protein